MYVMRCGFGTRSVFDYLDSHRDELIEMLSELVEIDSQWSNPDGVRQVGDILGNGLESIGFDVVAVPQPEVELDRRWLAEVLAPGIKYEDLGETLLCTRDGDGDSVLLLGDLDTALSPTHWGGFRIDGDRAVGTGIADMKGGLVVLLWALRALESLNLPSPPLRVVLAGDEQAGSLGSAKVIRNAAADTRFTLCVECARDGGSFMGSRGHIGVGHLDVLGKAAHAGTNRPEGINAVESLAKLIPALNAITDYEGGMLVTVTMMRGGRRRSLVPDRAQAVIDLRGRDETSWNSLIDEVGRILDTATREGVDLTFRHASHRPGVAWTRATDRLVERAQKVGRDLGINPGVTRSMAAGSSAFAALAGSTVLDGLGPPGGSLMTQDEYVEVSGVLERSALLAGLLTEMIESP